MRMRGGNERAMSVAFWVVFINASIAIATVFMLARELRTLTTALRAQQEIINSLIERLAHCDCEGR